MEFSGKTAFVTGAANGIGLGICRALARNGVNLVLADIERAALEKAREELVTFNVRTRATRRRPNSAISISCSTMPASRWDRSPCGR
jgi:NAD(P)-dependent dehydrogenase (short-subunit alcohol dehydrogenase family)